MTPTVRPFAAADLRARWVRAMFVFALVLAIAGAVSSLLQMELLTRVATGAFDEDEALANDLRQTVIGVAQMVVTIGCQIAFLMWFHRVHRNLPSLGNRGLKYSPRWAVGGFFVPFLNLVRPFQVMREVWHGSDPGRVELGVAERNRLGAPALVGWWWGLFLVSGVLGQIAFRMARIPEPTIPQLLSMSAAVVASDLFDVVLVVVALRLIRRITTWQSERVTLATAAAVF